MCTDSLDYRGEQDLKDLAKRPLLKRAKWGHLAGGGHSSLWAVFEFGGFPHISIRGAAFHGRERPVTTCTMLKAAHF